MILLGGPKRSHVQLLEAMREPLTPLTVSVTFCALCDLAIPWRGPRENLEADIAMVWHVGRCHPEAYEMTTGRVPSREWLEWQEATMRAQKGAYKGAYR